MNAFGFFLGRFAWQLGIRKERVRWNAVTRETQQLAEAQDLLGKLAWPSVEGIERLSGEFWQLRDLQIQQEKLRQKSDQLTAENETAQNRLYAVEDRVEDGVEALRGKKTGLMASSVHTMDQVEEIKDRDGETRRRFASLKGKLDVLKRQEGDFSQEIERTRQALATLKAEHSNDLAAVAAHEAEVARLEQAVEEIDSQIASLREAHKAETADLVVEIGRRSKQIAEISARVGSLESQKNQLSFQVGQFLSNQLDSRDPEMRKLLSRYGPLAARISYLRKSIQYNQRLARRASR